MNIVVAGIYRSGSTWLFNAVRFLTEESGQQTKGAFVWQQPEEEFDDKCEEYNECNVVKTHCFYEDDVLYFEPDFVITSIRKKEDIINSMKAQREKGLEDQFSNAGNWEEIDTFLDWLKKWRKHNKHVYEMNFNDLYNKSISKILSELNEALNLKLSTFQLESVKVKLSEMKAPLKGFDPITLLTPTHPNK